MKERLHKFWADDEEEKEEKKEVPKKSERKVQIPIKILVFLSIIALIPRLYFIFFVSDPQNAGAGWYGDTYHHWQIGYLTKEIGLSHGFLRLWDLKGMEYYWGLLHPLLLVIIFTLTGSIDILILRLLSVLVGIGVICLIYLLARRYWGHSVGLAAALLAALNPVNVFNDTTGMLEFFGIFPLLLALYLWPKRPFWAGILLGLATMARAEAWLFALGLLVVFLFIPKTYFDQKLSLLFGFGATMGFYLKYLASHTGNPIYPFWWNFLVGALGKWQTRPHFTPYQLEVRYYLACLVLLSLVALILLWAKRPKGLPLLLFGFATWLFAGGFLGLTAYLKSWEPWFWMIRFFAFPYIFLGLLLAILFLFIIPRRWPRFSPLRFGFPVLFVLLLFSQLAWRPILAKFSETERTWQYKKNLAAKIVSAYQGGTISIPEYEPDLTYALVRFGGISGRHIQGQMYTPFAYEPFIEYTDYFQNWAKDRQLIYQWLKKDDIRLMVVDEKREPFISLIKKEPNLFHFLAQLDSSPYQLYEVKSK